MENDSFTVHYIQAALWASVDDNGDPLNEVCSPSDLALETVARMYADCERFEQENETALAAWYALGETFERAGHDFWLTRNGHGTGFWDRHTDGGKAERLGRRLTDAAHAFGMVDLYVGEDGKIYQE